jgi:hypothetical protein
MSRRPLAGPQHLPGRDRVTELLGQLQAGTCGACGRAQYVSRREARYAARLGSPGTRLRAYRCGTSWHLGQPDGRPQLCSWPQVASAYSTGRTSAPAVMRQYSWRVRPPLR